MVWGMIGRLYADYLERRDKVQIYADILKVTKQTTKTTRILRLANVQYNTFLECMDTLCNAGLLEKISLDYNKYSSKKDNKKYAYKATEMGRKWCEALDEIYERLENS
jgi:predicted transcriptional regulator